MKKYIVSVVNFFFENLSKITTKLFTFNSKEDAQAYIEKELGKFKNDVVMSYYRNGKIMYPKIVKTDDKIIVTINEIYFYSYFLKDVDVINKYVASNVYFKFTDLNNITLELVPHKTRNDLDKYLDEFVEKMKYKTDIGYYGKKTFPKIKRNSAKISVHMTYDYYLVMSHVYFNGKFLS